MTYAVDRDEISGEQFSCYMVHHRRLRCGQRRYCTSRIFQTPAAGFAKLNSDSPRDWVALKGRRIGGRRPHYKSERSRLARP